MKMSGRARKGDPLWGLKKKKSKNGARKRVPKAMTPQESARRFSGTVAKKRKGVEKGGCETENLRRGP